MRVRVFVEHSDQRFYANSIERTIRHPAVAAICATARHDVFATPRR